MHLIKTGLLGNWKESNWFFVCLCVPAKEWGKVSFTINAFVPEVGTFRKDFLF